MIKLYCGRGDLNTLDTYLEKKLNSLPGKSDDVVRKELDRMIQRIQKCEYCLTLEDNPTSDYVRFLGCFLKIQKLSVEAGEDVHKAPGELKHALRLARRHFTKLNAAAGEEFHFQRTFYLIPIIKQSFSKIHQLKQVDKTFYYQTLAIWIDKQSIAINTLELSSKELRRLAPHLTFLKLSSAWEDDFNDKRLGYLLSRTKRLRHIRIEDCNITGAAFTKLRHGNQIARFVIERCPHLVHPLPERLSPYLEFKVEHCHNFPKQYLLDVLVTDYVNDREAALRFASGMNISHLEVLNHLFKNPEYRFDLEFMIQRLKEPELNSLIYDVFHRIKNHLMDDVLHSGLFLALFSTSRGKNFIEEHVFEFLEDPILLRCLYVLYPPGLIQNIALYPIKIVLDEHGDVLKLTMIPTMTRHYPDFVFDLLVRIYFKEIKIAHYGVADEGGRDPTRLFFADLLQGLIHSSQTVKFKEDNGKYVFSTAMNCWPVGNRILGMALHSGCPIGDVFSMEYLHCVRTFPEEDVNVGRFDPEEFLNSKNDAELMAYMRACVPAKAAFDLVERVLLSENEEDIRAAALILNRNWDNDDLKDALTIRDLDQIKGHVRRIWLEGYYEYINSANFIALGMKGHLPFEIRTINGGMVHINRWDDLARVSTEEFAMQLQGKVPMVTAFLRDPDYLDFVIKNIHAILADPELQPLVLAAYPPGVPENALFYPIKTSIREDVLYLTMIPSMPRNYPDLVMESLTGMGLHFHKISIAYFGSPAIDRGGPKKQFFSDLMQGIIHSSKIYQFETTESGKLIPQWGPMCNDNVKFYSLGKMMGMALHLGCPIGDVFCKEYIHCLRGFSADDLLLILKKDKYGVGFTCMTPDDFFNKKSDPNLIDYIRDSIPPSPSLGMLERVLLSESDADVTAAAKELNAIWIDDDLAEAIDEGNFHEIKGIVRRNWLDDYGGYIEIAHAIAQGILAVLPFEVKINDYERHTISKWEDLDFVTTEQFALQLQGKLTVEWIKNNLVFEPANCDKAVKVKKWMYQWFDEHDGDDEALANVIQTCTGARALANKVIFKLSPVVKGLYAHTCFRVVDVPEDIDEEGIREVLDAYARGEHVLFNRS